MIPPNLDISSEKFDAKKFLHFRRVPLPYPKAKVYNNIAEYYSHVFLRTAAVSNKLIKKQETRERNYEWYYDTLGLSESQRNLIQHNKKIQKRKGKKPVSIVTIPCSPLKSQRVTACKSDYKDYCRRKYRSLDSASAIMDIKPIKFEAFPSDSTSEPSLLSSSIKTENSAFVLPSIKLEEDEILPTSLNSVETHCDSSSIRIKSEPSESLSSLHFLTTKSSSTSCVVKPEPLENEDSCSDAILIRQVRSNVQRGLTLKNVYDSPDTIQIKKERTLSFNNNYGYSNAKYPYTTHNKNTFSNSRPGCSSNYHSLNASNNNSSLNETENKPSSQVEGSCAMVKNQKKVVKKQKKSSGSELKSKNDQKISKPTKKQSSVQNKDALNCDQSMKSTQNVLGQKRAANKENSSMNDSKSRIQPIKKCKKSTLKSQKDVLDNEKLPATVKTNNKLQKPMSKIKNSPVINQCTCKFPCGLSHLCTCGYYANAKEVLSKFKIPRKKK